MKLIFMDILLKKIKIDTMSYHFIQKFYINYLFVYYCSLFIIQHKILDTVLVNLVELRVFFSQSSVWMVEVRALIHVLQRS